MNMQNRQKGAATGLIIGVIVVIIIVILGVGYWWKHAKTVTTDDAAANATSTGYQFTVGNSTSTATTTGTVSGQKTETYTTYERRTVSATGNTTTATRYHNGTYGLTLGFGFGSSFAGFRTYETAGGPNGLPGTIQIHFIAPGESTDAFVVNVFSKEQWNKIRTQENYAHQNISDLGEGNYLGENFTWIYSDSIYSHTAEAQSALAGAVFY
jgi:hypothetical protein